MRTHGDPRSNLLSGKFEPLKVDLFSDFRHLCLHEFGSLDSATQSRVKSLRVLIQRCATVSLRSMRFASELRDGPLMKTGDSLLNLDNERHRFSGTFLFELLSCPGYGRTNRTYILIICSRTATSLVITSN